MSLVTQLQKHRSVHPPKSKKSLHEMRVSKMNDGSFHVEHHFKSQGGEPTYYPQEEYTCKNPKELNAHMKEHWGESES